jgi:hypothetical protein
MKEGAKPRPASNPNRRLKVFSKVVGGSYSRSAGIYVILTACGILWSLLESVGEREERHD